MDHVLLEEARYWNYHADFWFPDGNIIVLANGASAVTGSVSCYSKPDALPSYSSASAPSSSLPVRVLPPHSDRPSQTQPKCEATAFRLHRGVLARASPIWADQLDYDTGLQDPPEGLEPSRDSWENFLFGKGLHPSEGFGTNTSRVTSPCEVLRVDADPKDLIQVLRALYDGLYFYKDSHTPIAKFSILSSILRVTHKYRIHHIFDAALDYLHADWPTTLRDWDRREDALEVECERLRDEGVLYWGHEFEIPYTVEVSEAVTEGIAFAGASSTQKWEVYPHPIHVVKLARELGLSGILTSALYELARLRPSEIVLGAKPLCLPEDPKAYVSFFRRNAGEERPVGDTSSLAARYSTRFPGKTSAGQFTVPSVRLDRADVLLVLTAKERLKEYLSDFIRIVVDKRMIAQRCDKVNSEKCKAAFRGLCELVLREIVGNGKKGSDLETIAGDSLLSANTTGGCSASDPLGVLRVAANELSKVRGQTDDGTDAHHPPIRGACESCKLEFCVEVALARERCWEYMHHWFGLQQVVMDGADWELDDGEIEHEHEDNGDE